ncbi:unnamed protein product [Calypogeia fissa]
MSWESHHGWSEFESLAVNEYKSWKEPEKPRSLATTLPNLIEVYEELKGCSPEIAKDQKFDKQDKMADMRAKGATPKGDDKDDEVQCLLGDPCLKEPNDGDVVTSLDGLTNTQVLYGHGASKLHQRGTLLRRWFPQLRHQLIMLILQKQLTLCLIQFYSHILTVKWKISGHSLRTMFPMQQWGCVVCLKFQTSTC